MPFVELLNYFLEKLRKPIRSDGVIIIETLGECAQRTYTLKHQ